MNKSVKNNTWCRMRMRVDDFHMISMLSITQIMGGKRSHQIKSTTTNLAELQSKKCTYKCSIISTSAAIILGGFFHLLWTRLMNSYFYAHLWKFVSSCECIYRLWLRLRNSYKLLSLYTRFKLLIKFFTHLNFLKQFNSREYLNASEFSSISYEFVQIWSCTHKYTVHVAVPLALMCQILSINYVNEQAVGY